MQVPFTIRKSRKSHITEYVCGAFLLGLAIVPAFLNFAIKSQVTYFVGGVGLAMISIAEITRMMTYYKLMDSKMVVVKGFLKQDKKNVYFHPLGFVPDINVKQSRVQRLLDYGTIFVKGGEGNTFEIKDIDRPHTVMDVVEKLVESNRSPLASKKN